MLIIMIVAYFDVKGISLSFFRISFPREKILLDRMEKSRKTEAVAEFIETAKEQKNSTSRRR